VLPRGENFSRRTQKEPFKILCSHKYLRRNFWQLYCTKKGRKGAKLFEFCFSHKMPMTSFALKRFRSLLTHIFRGNFSTFGTAFKLCLQCCQGAKISTAELKRRPFKMRDVVCGRIFRQRPKFLVNLNSICFHNFKTTTFTYGIDKTRTVSSSQP
jgi:hypothetical protein